jgi:hypothetical protein
MTNLDNFKHFKEPEEANELVDILIDGEITHEEFKKKAKALELRPGEEPIEFYDESIENMVETVNESAKTDLSKFEKSNNDFVKQKREFCNVPENDPKIEIEILKVQENYKSKRKSFFKTFLSEFNSAVKYMPEYLAIASTIVHFTQQELPDYLPQKEKNAKEISWDNSTEKEVNKLAREYSLRMKIDSAYKDIPESVLENRFKDFVATWGHDIRIVHYNEDMNMGDAFGEWIFQKVLRQKADRAHYGNKTLYYESNSIKEKVIDPDGDFNTNGDTAKQYDLSTGSLGDFCAELSHHINGDYSFRRSFAYTEDLARKGFRQNQMYEDPYSEEYQAHSVTEEAIYKYLFPNDHNLDVDFVHIYNTIQDYYRKILETQDYEKTEDTYAILWDLISFKDFNEIDHDKKIVFENIDKIREAINKTDVSNNTKGELFHILTNGFALENTNTDYEIITQEALGIEQLLEARDVALKDSKMLDDLAKKIENKYLTDSKYVYASITEGIFSNQLIDSLKKNRETVDQETVKRLFKLHAYGSLRSVEGFGLGYKNFDDSRLYRGFNEYENYLRNLAGDELTKLSREGKDGDYSQKIKQISEELSKNETDEQLIYVLENYVKNSKSDLDANIDYYYKNLRLDWHGPTMQGLKSGLEEYGSPDLKRDFFEDGKSPLYKILE